jgi:hypothetical protein
MKITIYKNIYDKEPHYITVSQALARIKNGSSSAAVLDIRSQIDKERQDSLKLGLPSVCFSGEFKERKDGGMISHSGFIVLDFDDVFEVEKKKKELSENKYTYACWISPRNNGIKLLIKIADGKKHREHFEALRELFPEADKSGVNESRVCFESYDPEIFVNEKAEVFKKVKVVEKVAINSSLDNDRKIFDNIEKWLTNTGNAFQQGERNIYIFKLASACCRFGMDEENCIGFIQNKYEIGTNKFSVKECENTIKSGYRANKELFGSAHFDKEVLVDRTSRYEVVITQEMLDENIKPKDVIFGEDVKDEVFDIFNNGYQSVKGIGVSLIDDLFKLKEGEITLLSGYGNYGKSTFKKWSLLMRALLYGEKFAFFSPEDNAAEFYHDMTEILLGCNCTPENPHRPSKDEYEFAYDFISKYFFYVYPKVLSPTPEYIKERFLELIIKENVKGVVIDPFNQLTNDYSKSGGRSDKYLETFLSDCARFAQQNNIYFIIVAHPVKARKDERGNYPCPDVFDIADGAMWNNKMDNIIIYHRPNHQVDPSSDVCEFHSKKIRRQKMVGKKGTATFNYARASRRYLFNGVDYMATIIAYSDFYKGNGKKFNPMPVVPQHNPDFRLQPSKEFDPEYSLDEPPF